MIKKILAFYAQLTCEILQGLDDDGDIACWWHYSVCKPISLWEIRERLRQEGVEGGGLMDGWRKFKARKGR